MQDVVGAFPFEMFFGKQLQKTRRRLIEIDEAKADVERPGKRTILCVHDAEAYQSKDNVKNVIGRCPAGQTLLSGNYESSDSRQNQQGSKDQKYVIIQFTNPKNSIKVANLTWDLGIIWLIRAQVRGPVRGRERARRL